MSNTVLININEKERENGSVTLEFGSRVIRSLSTGNVHASGTVMCMNLCFSLL